MNNKFIEYEVSYDMDDGCRCVLVIQDKDDAFEYFDKYVLEGKSNIKIHEVEKYYTEIII